METGSVRTDRLGVVLEQFDQAREMAQVPTKPDRTPVTTIAWRLGHPHFNFAGQWEWTSGERRREPKELVEFTPDAGVAVERFWAMVDRWRAGFARD